MIRLLTLGGLALTPPPAGRQPQPRRLALLAALAEAGPPGLSRDALLARLWPEASEGRGRHALTQALYGLRRDTGEPELIIGVAQLALNPQAIETDLWDFRAALQRHDAAAMVQVYAGPFLAGFHLRGSTDFEDWVSATRRELAQEHVRALDQLSRSAHGPDQLRWLERLAVALPLDSRYALALARSRTDMGMRAEALRGLRTHERALRDELDVAPEPPVMALMQELSAPSADSAAAPAIARAAPDRTSEVSAAIPVPEPRPRWRPSRLMASLAVLLLAGSLALQRHRLASPADPLETVTGELHVLGWNGHRIRLELGAATTSDTARLPFQLEDSDSISASRTDSVIDYLASDGSARTATIGWSGSPGGRHPVFRHPVPRAETSDPADSSLRYYDWDCEPFEAVVRQQGHVNRFAVRRQHGKPLHFSTSCRGPTGSGGDLPDLTGSWQAGAIVRRPGGPELSALPVPGRHNRDSQEYIDRVRITFTADGRYSFRADIRVVPSNCRAANCATGYVITHQGAYRSDLRGIHATSGTYPFTATRLPSGQLDITQPGDIVYRLQRTASADRPDPVLESGDSAASEYSPEENPHGPWSAGWTERLGSPLHLFGFARVSPVSHVWIDPRLGSAPAFWRNLTGEWFAGVAPGDLALAPGCGNEFAVLRWQAPEAGSYVVRAQFLWGDLGETEAYVLRDADAAAPLLSAPSTNLNPVYRAELRLAAGESLDFVVGSKGDCTQDGTPIRLTITRRMS